ncbi:MAG: OadG family protein [Candidatus Coproplasma sp.]
MLNNLLSIEPGNGGSWAGQTQSPNNYYFTNWYEPFLYALIGFLVVFAGICIIIFTIWLVGLIMKKTNNLEFLSKGRKKKNVEEVKAKEPQATAETNDGDIPDEVKAAIIAAIMAYYEEKQEKCEFTVKRIKRI